MRRILKLTVGQQIAQVDMVHQLRDFELQETDYVYEPGQFAVRGSILDVYSYSCEYPFRIDFFGDEIDTIRTFNIETSSRRISVMRSKSFRNSPNRARSSASSISSIRMHSW